jgi:hypothetical protein
MRRALAVLALGAGLALATLPAWAGENSGSPDFPPLPTVTTTTQNVDTSGTVAGPSNEDHDPYYNFRLDNMGQ